MESAASVRSPMPVPKPRSQFSTAIWNELSALPPKLAGSASLFKADVSDGDQVNSAISTVLKRFGRINAVHNNAGIASPSNRSMKPPSRNGMTCSESTSSRSTGRRGSPSRHWWKARAQF